jgi:hypothetical protein
MVEPNIQRFKTSYYFSGTVRFVWAFLMAFGGGLLFINMLLGTLLLFIGLLVVTSQNRFEIDRINKLYHNYVWVLGNKTGAPQKFETLDYLFLKTNREKTVLHSQIQTTNLRNTVFDGYLRFSETEKILLFRSKSKGEVIKKIHPISVQLHLRVVDYT